MHLYRYRPLGQGLTEEREQQELEALERSYVWMSPFDKLNDPMEAFHHTVEVTALENASFTSLGFDPEPFRKKADVFVNLFKVTKNFNVCSFSEEPDNLSLWAYYANNFSGMIVEYNMVEMLKEHLGVHFRKVNYYESPPRISIEDYFGDQERFSAFSCRIKHSHWQHEKEWRLFGLHRGALAVNPLSIESVRIGPRTPSHIRSELERISDLIGFSIIKVDIEGFRLIEQEIVPRTQYRATSGQKCFYENCDAKIPKIAKKIGIRPQKILDICNDVFSYPNCDSICVIGYDEEKSILYIWAVMNYPNGTQNTLSFNFKAGNGMLAKTPMLPNSIQRAG